MVAERAGLEPDGEVIDARGALIVYRSPPAGTGAAGRIAGSRPRAAEHLGGNTDLD